MTRHPLDTFSLISGLLFVTLGTVFMLDQSDQITLNPRWIPAIVVFVLGFGGIVSNGRKAMRSSPPQFHSPAQTSTSGTPDQPSGAEPAVAAPTDTV